MHEDAIHVEDHEITATSESFFDEDVRSTAPCSYAQQRLWFFDRLQSGSALYNVEHIESLAGPLDVTALKRALAEIVRRHEALRTTFRDVGGNPIQVIGESGPVPLTHVDMTGKPMELQSAETNRVIADEIKTGFDLGRGPLVRFTLIEFDTQRQLLLLVAHHIVFDLWSAGVFSRELATLYTAFKSGQSSNLPEPALSYAAHVASERPRFESAEVDPQLAYWRAHLAGLPMSTELPTDRPRLPVQTFRGALRAFAITPDVARPFRALTRGAGATMFMSLFAAFIVLMHRYSGQTDLAVGTPIANRSRPHLGEMIGFLLNMLVLRVDVSDDPTVSDLLARVVETSLSAFDNQDVPFELLVEDLKPMRDPSRNPMFQTMFVFQPGRPGENDEDPSAGESNGAKFDITLTITDAAPGLRGHIEFNTDLFDPPTIDRLVRHYEAILSAMAARPDTRISELSILGADERHRILVDWNATATPSLPPGCLHDLFEKVAATTPDAVAVSYEDARLTYGELDRRAEALAKELRSHGAGAEGRVGICMERSLDWIVAIFAVLKSGAAMVPLDGAFPRDRLLFMIEDSSISIIVTQSSLAAKVADTGATIIALDMPRPAAAPFVQPQTNPAKPENLAYVVYTSGSTGKPKGVLVQHDSAVNYTVAQIKDWSFGPGARALQFTAFGFDIGLSEIFMTLCSGAEFCLASADDLRAGPPLLRTLRDLRITHVTLPPSALAAMQPEPLPDLGLIISAGEPCEPGLAKRWAAGRSIVNAYGPTEATIYATIGSFDPVTSQFPVGRPIPNVQVYVLDKHGEPVPAGVVGEIFIGGIGVARGYLNRPELTAQRFVPDRLSGRPGGHLYATGDYGRFDPRGVLHHLGRMDSQLKIRGYRIEPGEIESLLRLHDQVTDALVLGHGIGPDARLVAFIIPTDPPPLIVELRSFLARQLPEYMAPAAYVMLDQWPKTPNGKIDRLALPRPGASTRDAAAVFVAPHDDLEQAIAAVWRDCLDLDEVGVTDNFFDLGGHSLLLVRVHSQLREKLKTDLSLIDLFRFPTIKLQAEMMKAQKASPSEAETLGRADQRAARQNAARMQRRARTGADRHA